MTGEVPRAQPPPAAVGRPAPWRRPRNPLRRPTDVARAWLGPVLAVVLLAATPTVALLVGDAAHHRLGQDARQQARTRQHIEVVLVHAAPRHPEPGSDEARAARYPVPVRFTGPDGRVRTVEAEVPQGLPAGSTARVWVDDRGRVTEPPLTREQVRNGALGWGLVAAGAVALAGAAAYSAVRYELERRDLAAWETAWARTAPRWTSSA
ncbi:hypothetical protein IHE55_24110 [Streptomyces pactum]|uniref:Proline rich protein membrane protein n=1 Tax=Streptomyces pactum TaxID=68249 RepID=A0ABS0NR55_9ACTN|nr:hypothetical protein [Streptomyces pactum]MBH5337688.1 hypothetical protein [Streptomyces pactum]